MSPNTRYRASSSLSADLQFGFPLICKEEGRATQQRKMQDTYTAALIMGR